MQRVSISRESCKLTGFPDLRAGCWGISRESGKFTVLPTKDQACGV